MSEQWKAVPGYEGIYEVSDYGRVRSVDRVAANGARWKGVILRQSIDKDGYPLVALSNVSLRTFKVHRLVLEAFVGPCPEGMEACHWPDNDRVNCRLRNLRWDTRKNNHADKATHGTLPRGERNSNSVLTQVDVERIFDLHRSGRTQKQIADHMEVCPSHISKILSGERWAHLATS